MATIRGKPKKQIGYKIPTDIQKKIDFLIDEGEFSSQADIITAALRQFFDKREFELIVENKIIEVLNSEKGRALLETLFKK